MSTDQGNTPVTSDETSTNQEVKIKVGNREYTPEELAENYQNLEKEFTRKSQELSEVKKGKTEEANWSEKEVMDFLAKQGVVTVSDLEKREKENLFFSANPNLQTQRWAITKLAQAEWIPVEEAVVKYWFSTEEKLQKSRQRELVGTPNTPQKEKPISEMSLHEYEIWREKNITPSSNGF